MSNLLSQASLVMIPSGYKEDVVYSPIPTTGAGDLSFTRASNGTRINSAGLVEVVPWNMSGYSEEFNNAYWTKAGATITANDTTAPNGTTTADKVLANAANSEHGIYNATAYASNFVGEVYTYSVYAKKGTVDFLVLDHYQGSYTFTWFNLNTGTLGTVANGVTASIENVGNGWYRCSCTKAITATTLNYMGIYLSNANNTWSFNSAGTETIYIWGAQVNLATAKPYFPTTDRLNVPRLTYQNGGGGCPSLLLEKQSTNIATYSEDATQWNKGSNVGSFTVTANQTISPDGTQNADKVQFPAVGSGSQYAVLFFPFTASATTYTGSVWIKGENGGEVVWINFTKDGVNYTQTLCTLTTSWQRFTLSSTLTSGADNFQIGVDTRDSAESAKPAQTIYVWGRQLEASSYPTSYIPTTSASATRVGDVAYKTSATALIGQTEGVLFCDFNLPSVETSGDYPFVVNMYDSNSNRFGFARYPNGGVHIYMISGGSSQFTYNTTQLTGRFKLALGYKANDCVIYLNGTLLQTITSATIPATSQIIFNDLNVGGGFTSQSQINQAVLFKTRLTNAELASLTTI